MKQEIDLLEGLPGIRQAAELFRAKGGRRPKLALGGLWGSSQALVASALVRRIPGPTMILLPDPEEAELFAEDLGAFGTSSSLFPCVEAGPPDPEALSLRLAAAEKLDRGEAAAPLVGSLLALIQPVPEREALRLSFAEIERGAAFRTAEFLGRLESSGFRRKALVGRPGEMSLRGAILDFFPLTAEWPVRVEVFDGRIESIRDFDPDSQRSRHVLQRFAFNLGGSGSSGEGKGLLPDYWPKDLACLLVEPLKIQDREKVLRLQDERFARNLGRIRGKLAGAARVELHSLPTGGNDFGTFSVQGMASGSRTAAESVRGTLEQTPRIHLFCRTEAETKRLGALLADQGLPPGEDVRFHLGSLAAGFRFPALGATFLNHHELMGIPRLRRPGRLRRDLPTVVIRSFLDLDEGDLVVHEVHGVGRFLGIQRVKKGKGEEDHLLVEFADEAHLFVPTSRIDLVQKYVGAGGVEPRLDRIGSGAFLRRKENVQKALVDLAGDLLEIQALRQARQGTSYPEDDELQRDLEASFPFPETEDQTRIMREIKADLRSPRPMDRLLCGDVGYGKTELAIRAAFKVVSGGQQVALLVPTTILAEQHFQTFRERLADYPVRIEALSRFRTEKEQKRIVEEAKEGRADILIGTHRILSGDIGFRSLGLVIIDEEQRFGVRHKERLKQLRATVDVLTLTATPIPRTLHMALVGIRDISSLTTPPLGRESVETLIRYREEEATIRDAIRRELNRGGQVFFLHNRVQTIRGVAAKLRSLVPEARFGIAHGQMAEGELEEVMRRFVAGELDVLVTTAIIESGLDIPRANTILIDHAQRFGLADLHQLRGRVGRWKHKAHCILLLPRSEPLPPAAKARIKAIEELQELGAGFSIAMRDLEIRGAGNILGPEQSGHIGAVGYDMYCRLLRATVERMTPGSKAGPGAEEAAQEPVDLELGVAAYLPPDYVEEKRLRLGILRELDEIRDEASREKAAAALEDRFGPLPREARNLLDLFWIKRALAAAGVRSVHFSEDRFLLEYTDRLRLSWALRPAFPDIRYVEAGKAHVMISGGEVNPERALALLREACSGLRSPQSPGSTPAALPV